MLPIFCQAGAGFGVAIELVDDELLSEVDVVSCDTTGMNDARVNEINNPSFAIVFTVVISFPWFVLSGFMAGWIVGRPDCCLPQ